MKLIKISTDHYVIVDDSEIKEGDYYLSYMSNKILQRTKLMDIVEVMDKKITHSTQPLDKSLFFTDRVWGCEKLSLGEVKELIGAFRLFFKNNMLEVDEIIQSLQPKTEWDVEIEMEDSFTKNDEVYVDENNAKGNYYTHSKKPKLDADGCLILKLKSE